MSDPFAESTSQIIQSGRVKTASRLYKFWLCAVRGYSVEKKVTTPLGYSLGRLKYKTRWVLKPEDAE